VDWQEVQSGPAHFIKEAERAMWVQNPLLTVDWNLHSNIECRTLLECDCSQDRHGPYSMVGDSQSTVSIVVGPRLAGLSGFAVVTIYEGSVG
jgi:hypothetical protein